MDDDGLEKERVVFLNNAPGNQARSKDLHTALVH